MASARPGRRRTRSRAFFGQAVTALELVSPRFYHLDVCFCPLSGGEILYYPPAFSADRARRDPRRVAPEDLIEATDEDAARFTINAVNIGRPAGDGERLARLVARLAERGYRVTEIDLCRSSCPAAPPIA